MLPAVSRLQSALTRQKLDAILISQPENRRFVSGYTALDHSINESSGYLLILRRGTPLLLTDFRYQLQAEREAEGFKVLIYKRGLQPLLIALLRKLGIATLGFEAHYFLHTKYLQLARLADSARIRLVALDGLVERLRQIKNSAEVAAIRRSVRLNETVFQTVYPTIRPGQTEIDIALAIENTMRQLGAERPSFDTIVASGPNAALPHAVPSHRQLQTGEPIIIDMGLILAGYCSDMTRTIVLGTPDAQTVTLLRLVRQAQQAALTVLGPGISGRDVDKAARDLLTDAGYDAQFGHGLGHGVGLAVHESPSLSVRNRKQLRPGMVVTVEPGIYIKGWGGIRLENMAVITETGHELLNQDATFLDI